MIEIYTDGSYRPSRNKTGLKRSGRIAYKLGDLSVLVLDVSVPVIPYLKQYSNLFELFAIAEALEKIEDNEDVRLYSDSQVAVGWTKRFVNDLGKFSPLHEKLKTRVDCAKKRFKSFGVYWVSRDNNPAGHELELRKKKVERLQIPKKPKSKKVATFEMKIRRAVADEFRLNEHKLVIAYRYNQSFINEIAQRIMTVIDENKGR